MSKKTPPSPCKTCSKTFCSDNGPCGIREKKNSEMADALRRLAQLCKQEREDNGGKELCEQCWRLLRKYFRKRLGITALKTQLLNS